MIDRRRFLRLGGLTAGGVAGIALLPKGQGPTAVAEPTALAGPATHTGHEAGVQAAAATPVTTLVAPFGTLRMPVPRELTPTRAADGADVYRMPIQAARAEIMPGHPTTVRTYAGQFVGPTIRARTGRPVRVTFTNQMDIASNVHLHGGHNPQVSDGYPMDVIAPGASRTYEYPNRQQGATLWYHDHAHMLEAENVYYGLHGFYLLEDEAELRLGLPSGEFDVPIMLRDCALDENGTLLFATEPSSRDTVLANGVVTPYFPVAARKYRLRLLNSSLSRTFRLTLGGAQITQIGSDGGLLPAPERRNDIVLGPAERADVVVDFSGHPVGSQLVLFDVTGAVLRFDVTRTAADQSRVPQRLRPLPALPPATVERDVVFTFDVSGPTPVGLINGRPFDPNRVDFTAKRGSTEIWRIKNGDEALGAPHTFHLHLEQFRVLDRDGGTPLPGDEGRKDTVFVAPGETVRIEVTFADYLGLYPFHCHFIEHSSMGMMAQVRIVP
jgi:FtsP/CotA-like multicopper oxidase with cupredoxin domain